MMAPVADAQVSHGIYDNAGSGGVAVPKANYVMSLTTYKSGKASGLMQRHMPNGVKSTAFTFEGTDKNGKLTLTTSTGRTITGVLGQNSWAGVVSLDNCETYLTGAAISDCMFFFPNR
jgi:hypothetical protein